MPTSDHERHKVFISYSHQDAKWLARLRVHLKPLERDHKIDIWDDTRIEIGAQWRDEIREAMRTAKVAVLLISADFLASDFIATDELPPLLSAAEQEGAVIMPLILSPSRFTEDARLSKFQTANDPRKPLSGMDRTARESVLVKLSEAIEDALRGPARPAPEEDAATPAQDAARPAPRPVSASPVAQTPAPARDAVQPVTIEHGGGGFAYGFFTPRGYIVTLSVSGLGTSKAVWRVGEQEYEAAAILVRVQGYAALLKLEGVGLLRSSTPVGLCRSLQPGDPVERVLGPDDRAEGRVLSVAGNTDWGGDVFLHTTVISFVGDAGAPVVDSAGKIVAMVLGKDAAQTKTVSLPVETIKLAFREAF